MVILLLFLFLPSSFGTTVCNTTSLGINPQCSTNDSPYCVLITPNSTDCRACTSNCDCDYNQYCSQNPQTIGMCMNFDQAGSSCFPYSASQLTNANFSGTLKCAALYTINTTIYIDQQGVCIGKSCQYCDYRGNGGIGNCNPTDGVKSARACVYPGTQINVHSVPWNRDTYFETPENVWWAIYFVFFFIIIIVQAAMVFVQYRGNGGTSKSKDLPSSPSSQITHSTDTGTHNTTSPTSPSSEPPSNTSAHQSAQEDGTGSGYDAPPSTKPYDAAPSKHSSVNSHADVIVLTQQ